MKLIITLIAIAGFIVGCSHKISEKKILTELVSNGYISNEYTFSDSGIRNLKIRFVNDTVLEVSNAVIRDHAPSQYRWLFSTQYKYSSPEVGVIAIEEVLSENNKLIDGNYVKPYSRAPFQSLESVFPDIKGDSIFFSQDFMKIQIREFSFGIVK